MTIVRGSVLFATLFPVLILRKADLHVQFHPLTTPFSVVSGEFFALNTLHGITAYTASALSLTFLYLRNLSDLARLSTTITRGYELPRLNERLVYLVSFSIYTSVAYGLLQKAAHRTLLPYTSVSAHLRTELMHSVMTRLTVAAFFAMSCTTVCPVFYVFVRPIIWKYALRLARMFVKMPRSPNLPSFPLGIDLLCRSLMLSFLMAIMWESAHLFFDSFVGKTPASQGEILSDKSDDPNGTLITGLQSREKPFTQATAFEELTLIANHDKARRQTIFLEHRNGTSSWNHILRASLEVLAEIRNKHSGLQQPSQQFSKVAELAQVQPESAHQLAVKQTNIFVTRQSHKVPFEFARASEEKSSAVITNSIISAEGLWLRLHSTLSNSQVLALGWLFRACVELRATSDLPHVRVGIQAVQAISQLVVKSADEDTLGMVQWDLGVLLNCLCLTLKALESYVRTPHGEIHTPKALLQRKVLLLEQEILGTSIKLAIRDIVHRFGEHLDGMGLENETAEICQSTWNSEMI